MVIERDELLKKRNALAKENHDRVMDEDFGKNSDNKDKADQAMKEIEIMDVQLKSLDQSIGAIEKKVQAETPLNKTNKMWPHLNAALRDFALHGLGAVSDEHKNAFGIKQIGERGNGIDLDLGLRNLLTTDGADTGAGAATTSEDKVIYEEQTTEVIHSLDAYGGVRQMVAVRATEKGNDLPYPQMSNHTQEGEIISSEGTKAAALDIAEAGQVKFTAYTYSSKSMSISRELVQDAFVDMVAIILQEGYRRIGRITNKHFTAGSGVNQPKGVKIVASAGITTASKVKVEYPELVNLIHSVNPAYRVGMETPDMRDGGRSSRQGRVGFMISDSMLREIKNVRDLDGRPLWLPSIVAGEPNSILGYPYAMNYNLDAWAASAVPMLFGNFGYYMIRDVTGIEVFRFTDSAYAERNTIGFLMFVRCDGRSLGPGAAATVEPIKKLTVKA